MQQLMGPISLINPLTITPIAAYTPTAFNQQVAVQSITHRPKAYTSLLHKQNNICLFRFRGTNKITIVVFPSFNESQCLKRTFGLVLDFFCSKLQDSDVDN